MLLQGQDGGALMAELDAILDTEAVLLAQQRVQQVYVADVVLDYLPQLVAQTRLSQEHHGLSPRGVLSLQRAAQAYAYVSGHTEVTPEDIQAVFAAVVDHRLGQRFIAITNNQSQGPKTLAQRILTTVKVLG